MFILKWIGYALAVMFIAWLIPGITVSGIWSALLVAVVLGLINTLIKPILMFISLPLNFLTFGLFTLLINGALMLLAGAITPGFQINGFWSAFWGALVLSLIATIINMITKKPEMD